MMTTRHRLASALPSKFHIRETLSTTPCTLPSDSGERVKLLQRKLRTGNPIRMAEVVRDLAWR